MPYTLTQCRLYHICHIYLQIVSYKPFTLTYCRLYTICHIHLPIVGYIPNATYIYLLLFTSHMPYTFTYCCLHPICLIHFSIIVYIPMPYTLPYYCLHPICHIHLPIIVYIPYVTYTSLLLFTSQCHIHFPSIVYIPMPQTLIVGIHPTHHIHLSSVGHMTYCTYWLYISDQRWPTGLIDRLIDWLKILFNLCSTLSKILFSVAEPLIHHLHTFILLYIQYIHILFTDKIIKITNNTGQLLDKYHWHVSVICTTCSRHSLIYILDMYYALCNHTYC